MQNYARCKIMQGTKSCKLQNYAKRKTMPDAKFCKVWNYAKCTKAVTIKSWAPKVQMLMHHSGRYVLLCVRPTILISFKVYMKYILHASVLLVCLLLILREAYMYQDGWISKGGREVISDLKNFIANLFALETIILVMNFWKNFKTAKRGGGNFRYDKFHCKFCNFSTKN